MRSSTRCLFRGGCLLFFVGLTLHSFAQSTSKPKILVFSMTNGYRHESIPKGIAAIEKLGTENGFEVDATEDSTQFTEENLNQYRSVVFLCTTGDVLNDAQQVAFQKFIQSGKGYVGIHAAADTEYDWPWYNKLAGAYFKSHPKQQKAIVQVIDKKHVSTSFLPDKWERFDEWYSYKSIQPDLKVLAKLDEKSYAGGENGDNHPIAWYHDFEGGRAFYTGFGHTDESYLEPLFLRHLLGGIQYTLGDKKMLGKKGNKAKAN
ncbi:MAG: ThuA domain-containing protein [Ferruginibacter sp.]|nr:ThuA domain-containing protein [Cytophagales bacterium]